MKNVLWTVIHFYGSLKYSRRKRTLTQINYQDENCHRLRRRMRWWLREKKRGENNIPPSPFKHFINECPLRRVCSHMNSIRTKFNRKTLNLSELTGRQKDIFDICLPRFLYSILYKTATFDGTETDNKFFIQCQINLKRVA